MSEDVLADLIERCRKSEASLMALNEDRDPTTHDCYRIRGKRDGVALVRGYIEEAARHLRLHGPEIAPPEGDDSWRVLAQKWLPIAEIAVRRLEAISMGEESA